MRDRHVVRRKNEAPYRVVTDGRTSTRNGVTLHHADVLDLYDGWASPTCIVADGPYGLHSYPGDPPTPEGLGEVYRPHIEAWSRRSTPETTLWFWNSELGWANVHPVLAANGWEYRSCHVWNKGLSHVAGNANSLTLRKFPVVTEVCVQYVKPARFPSTGGDLSMKDWLRKEWMRSGLPMYLANKACGVKNAATRKYLTACHLWYFPPPEAFTAMARFVNEKGDPKGRPYFSLDGKRPIPGSEWAKLRSKFVCEVGINNVWEEPPVRGSERLKRAALKCLHMNQKPLRLLDIAIRACTDEDDLVWEPFGGLCSVAVSSHRLRRRCVSAEVNLEFFRAAAQRLATYDSRSVLDT